MFLPCQWLNETAPILTVTLQAEASHYGLHSLAEVLVIVSFALLYRFFAKYYELSEHIAKILCTM